MSQHKELAKYNKCELKNYLSSAPPSLRTNHYCQRERVYSARECYHLGNEEPTERKQTGLDLFAYALEQVHIRLAIAIAANTQE